MSQHRDPAPNDVQSDPSGNLGGPPTSTIPKPRKDSDNKDAQHDTPGGKDYEADDDTPQQGGM